MKRLIVESKNDKAFVEALLLHLEPNNEVIAKNIVHALDKEGNGTSRGLSKSLLEKTLRDTLDEISLNPANGDIQIGILIDADREKNGAGIQNRLIFVNEVMNEVFGENPNFIQPCVCKNDFKTITVETPDTFETITIQIGCHFVNINGEGELENVLMAIADKDKAFAANCLEAWRNCYTEKLAHIPSNMHITNIDSLDDKQLVKVWQEFFKIYDVFLEQEFDRWYIQFYHKFDTVKRTKRGNSAIDTDFEFIFLGKENNGKQVAPRYRDMYDFDNKTCNEFQELCGFLKAFL
ncbi:MAG: hypothetical protein RI894_1458 [Bacteroidota bacterium]|jgi:hypothetical protein